MININGVGVGLNFEDNIKKIIANGFKETIIEQDEDTKQKLKSISKLFTNIKKFKLNDRNILITCTHGLTSMSVHYIENMSELDYLKWSKGLLKIYHEYSYNNLPFKNDKFKDAVDIFSATDNEYNMNYAIIEKMDGVEDKFSILNVDISPKNLGLNINSNGSYTKRNMIKRNDNFSIGEILGAAGTAIGLFGLL